ncbi:MAG TPA: hypothetical protein VES88_10645 [Gemmatimonadaceae bacterium]|nr:hypothetical protein [Gemmatimonadaceae bacterium]
MTGSALASAKKDTNGVQARDASTKTALSGRSASASQDSAGSAKTKARGPADTRCGIKGNPVLTTTGVGNLAIGRSVDTVKGSCRIIRDVIELTSEGTLDNVLTLVIGGDIYRASVKDGLVWRVTVRTPRIATRDGLRIGTPLSRVAALKGVKLAEGEDGLYLLPPTHCGLSFRFSVQSRWPTGRPWTLEEVVRRHGSRPVDRIFVTRCVRSA